MATEDEDESFSYSFVSESEPMDEYICPLSGKVMLDPHQTDCCGNHISASRVEKLLRAKKPCPLCEAPNPADSTGGTRVFTTHRDLFYQRKVLNLLVYCPHSDNGCQWEGPLADLQSHTLSCDMQPWKCQYCGFKTMHGIGTANHAPSCPKRPVMCQDCDQSILHCDSEEHREACPSRTVSCEFAHVGCKSEFPQRESSQHALEHLSKHQLLVSQHTLKLTTELREEVGRSNGALERLQEQVDKLSGEIEVKNTQIGLMEEQAKKLEEQVREKEREMETLKASCVPVAATTDERDRQVRRLQEQLEEKEEEADMRGEGGGGERRDSVHIGRGALESLQRVVQGLRLKTSLGKKELGNLTTQLEEIVTGIVETQSQNSYGSSMDLVGTATSAPFCCGKFEKVVAEGLRKPWGLAMGSGNKLYVVDNSGSFGLHIVNLDSPTPSSSVTTMIQAASISEITIPPEKCWYPRGVALDRESNVILVDTGTHRVLKFSPEGSLLHLAGSEATPGNASGQFNAPVGVGVDQQNRVFVCDRLNHRLQVLDSELRFLRELGESGSGLSEFCNPWDVGFDQRGNVYVADCGNRCVKVFTPDLQPLREVGRPREGKYRKGDLRAPSSLCLDDKDHLYVADMGLKKVLVYDLEGNFKCSFGRFTEPRGLAVDQAGHVYVSDMGGGSLFYNRGRVQMFS